MADDANVNEQNLHNYIERVTALQNQRNSALTLSDLQSVARELGMSDEDLAAASRSATAALERGLGHIKYRLWDDAIEELSNSVALDPANVQGLHALAVAYSERWRGNGSVADLLEAQRHARQALQIDPKHAPSFDLLSRLKEQAEGAPSRISPVARKRTLTIAIIVIIAVVVILALMIWAARTNNAVAPL
jgi:tetratricopeptide (TPR) repeat protein